MLFSAETMATLLLIFGVWAMASELWRPEGAGLKVKASINFAVNVALGLLVQVWALTVVGFEVPAAFSVVLGVTLAVALVNYVRDARSAR